MQRSNELVNRSSTDLDASLARIWSVMDGCIERGLVGDGVLPGGLKVARRAKRIHRALLSEKDGPAPEARAPHTSVVDWLLTYAMAVNEVGILNRNDRSAVQPIGPLSQSLGLWQDWVPRTIFWP